MPGCLLVSKCSAASMAKPKLVRLDPQGVDRLFNVCDPSRQKSNPKNSKLTLTKPVTDTNLKTDKPAILTNEPKHIYQCEPNSTSTCALCKDEEAVSPCANSRGRK